MRKAFTLIELLIVVAIIAILAAIAVPNFLEAQVRSKVSRAKADMRSTSLAIETYLLDYNTIPPDGNDINNWPYPQANKTPAFERPGMLLDGKLNANNYNSYCFRLFGIWKFFTTPIAYMSSVPPDPFSSSGVPLSYETWVGIAGTPWLNKPVFCVTTSWGPMKYMTSAYNFPDSIYDPSNGTISAGNMYRIGAIKDAGYAKNRFGASFDFMPH